MEKTIVSSCPFPLIKLNVNLKYAEVQKPSGIGYIILVLIKDAKDRSEHLTDVLKRFGVPEDLRFIFADEIEVLLNRGILQLVRNNRYQREYFEEYTIGNFEFTPNGERMFREGAIPTGEEKSKQAVVYFNPLTFEFSFFAQSYMALEKSSCYPEGFMQRVESDLTGLKEYLIDNTSGVGLQKEERLLECSITGREDVFTKAEKNLELRVDEDGFEISLKTAGAEDFYEKYFTPDMLERELAAKNKFKFSIPTKSVKGFSVFKALSAVYLPEEYEKQIARPVKLLIVNDDNKISIKRGGNETILQNGKIVSEAVGAIFPDWSFITIDAKEMRFYTAANISLTERVLDKPVSFNLLVEQLYGAEEKAKIIKAIYDECTFDGFSLERCNLVKAVYELSENAEFVSQYTNTKIKQGGDREKQSEILLTANKVFNNNEWVAIFAEYANEIYNGLIADITKENVGYVVKIIKTLNDIRKPNKEELLLAVAEKFSKTMDAVTLFILLTDAGFGENEALSVANAVKAYIEKVLAGETEFARSSISDGFAALSSNLSDLKENLGIKSVAKYTFRDSYNIVKFAEEFKAFQSKLSGIIKYAGFAPDGFEELAKYEKIMQPAFDYIMIERNASQSPERISETYIRQKIGAGDWCTAIGDMVIRLDYILGKQLEIKKGDNSDVFEKIDRAKKEKIITGSEADTLHELRKFRNRLQHPTETQLVFDREKIMQWADAVFSIVENNSDSKKEGKK